MEIQSTINRLPYIHSQSLGPLSFGRSLASDRGEESNMAVGEVEEEATPYMAGKWRRGGGGREIK